MSARLSSPNKAERFNQDPFRLLGVSPRAAATEITAVHAQARQRQSASQQYLDWALGKLLDPDQRLSFELAYPLDAKPEQVTTFYSALSDGISMGDASVFSSAFPPLAQANFVAGYAACAPLAPELLVALINAHAAIDPVMIYDLLKSVRQSAALPPPPLLAVREGLQELIKLHAAAVLAGHDLSSASRALSECARQTLAENDSARVEALSHLLDRYTSLSAPQRRQSARDVALACLALWQDTQGSSMDDVIGRMETAFNLLVTLSEPQELDSRVQSAELSEAIAQIKDLLARLTDLRDYQTAKRVLDAVAPALSPTLLSASEFIKVRDVLVRLLIRDAIATLRSEIEHAGDDPRAAVRAFERLAFDGPPNQDLGGLAHAFRHAVEQTKSTPHDEQPWTLVRQFTLGFSATRPELAVALLRRLVELGESMSPGPSTLTDLRADLAGLSADPLSEANIAKRRSSRGRRILVAAALSLLASGVLALTHEMGFLQTSFWSMVDQQTAKQDPGTTRRQAELLPPVGKGSD